MSAEAAASEFTQFCIQYSSLALLYYDYALTFPLEVKHMWGEKIRVSTILYILCRYALVGNLLYLFAIAGLLTHGCDRWYKLVGALSVLGRAAVIFAMTAKTFALFGRNCYVLAYFMLVGITCIALDITHVPGLRCSGSFDNVIASELLHVLMMVFEYSAAFAVLLRNFQAHKVGQTKGFLHLIVEHGIIYFSIVSLFTTASVVLNFAAPNWFLQRLLNALTLPLSCIFTARFLLALRAWESDRSSGISSDDEGIHLPTGMEFEPFEALVGAVTAIDDFGCDPVRVARQELEQDLPIDGTFLDDRAEVDSSAANSPV